MSGQMQVTSGDITTLRVDAIVNAANEALLPGGGVCGAIHRAAGPGLWEECRKIGLCDPGRAVITGGHNLPATYVVHTAGPVWDGGDDREDETLASCYEHSLRLAAERGVRTIAFPAISTGIYGFPSDRAAKIAVATVARWLAAHDLPAEVTFVCFDAATRHAYDGELKAVEGV